MILETGFRKKFSVLASGLLGAFLTGCGGSNNSAPTGTTVSPPIVINKAPIISNPGTISLTENENFNYSLSATDAEGDTIKFSLGTDEDESYFNIDENTGALSSTSAFDFEAPEDKNSDNIYRLKVLASDGTASSFIFVDVSISDILDVGFRISGYATKGPIYGAEIVVLDALNPSLILAEGVLSEDTGYFDLTIPDILNYKGAAITLTVNGSANAKMTCDAPAGCDGFEFGEKFPYAEGKSLTATILTPNSGSIRNVNINIFSHLQAIRAKINLDNLLEAQNEIALLFGLNNSDFSNLSPVDLTITPVGSSDENSIRAAIISGGILEAFFADGKAEEIFYENFSLNAELIANESIDDPLLISLENILGAAKEVLATSSEGNPSFTSAIEQIKKDYLATQIVSVDTYTSNGNLPSLADLRTCFSDELSDENLSKQVANFTKSIFSQSQKTSTHCPGKTELKASRFTEAQLMGKAAHGNIRMENELVEADDGFIDTGYLLYTPIDANLDILPGYYGYVTRGPACSRLDIQPPYDEPIRVPRHHTGGFQYAYDIGGKNVPDNPTIGTPVVAIAKGRVVAFRDASLDNWTSRQEFKFPPGKGTYQQQLDHLGPGGMGNYVTLEFIVDGKYFYATYQHLKRGSIEEFGIAIDMKVSPGDTIGRVGMSGSSGGPHLHIQFSRYLAKYAPGWLNPNGKLIHISYAQLPFAPDVSFGRLLSDVEGDNDPRDNVPTFQQSEQLFLRALLIQQLIDLLQEEAGQTLLPESRLAWYLRRMDTAEESRMCLVTGYPSEQANQQCSFNYTGGNTPNLPDLQILNIRELPTEMSQGDDIEVEVEIENVGDIFFHDDLYLRLELDSSQDFSDPAVAKADYRLRIEPGESETFTITMNDAFQRTTGKVWVKLIINPDTAFSVEQTDQNNEAIYGTIYVPQNPFWVQGSQFHDTLDAHPTIDSRLWGYAGDDILFGADGDDKLFGGLGNDTLWASSGNDLINGNDGSDTFYVGRHTGNVQVIGGEGVDLLSLYDGASSIATSLDLQAGNGATRNAQITVSGVENVEGSPGRDEIFGSNDSNTLHGREGDDELWGKSGDDVIYGNEGADFLSGDEGDDRLSGGEGEDLIQGNEGNDFIYGGPGNDSLGGFEGNNLFYFKLGDGHDEITNFKSSNDKISLEICPETLFDALKARFEQSGSHTMIRLSDNQTITIHNIKPDQLNMTHFIFGENHSSE